jgi:hypothetical protein
VSKDRIGSNDIEIQTKKDSSGEAVVEDVKEAEPAKDVLPFCDLRASVSPLKMKRRSILAG